MKKDDNKKAAAEQPILEIDSVEITYYSRVGALKAVIDFSLEVWPSESIGVVGESGCGKSTVAMAIMRYLGRNGAVTKGSIKFKGRDLLTMGEEELRKLRGADISMIYQEPMAALNPSMTVGNQLMEVPKFHFDKGAREAQAMAEQILADVRIPDPKRLMDSWPHQISGGQQQRVVIAMALLAKPSLLLLDEPTTALDVTVEAGIINLIENLARRQNTAMIFISHNMGLIARTCNRVYVMYSGQLVEKGTVQQIFESPQHPYTHGLFNCIPNLLAGKDTRPLNPIRGQLPSMNARPPGCFFSPRCDFFQKGLCDQEMGLTQLSDTHAVRCVRIKEIDWEAEENKVEHTKIDLATIGERILDVEDISKHYGITDNSVGALLKGERHKEVKAIQGMSFNVCKGQTVAIVGESGCGKSTFAKLLIGLESKTKGSMNYEDNAIDETLVQDRSPQQIGSLQMIFQNPNDTLNPTKTVGQQLARAIRKFGVADKQEISDRIDRLLDLIKLPRHYRRFKPRQLSGGQKQRVGIARAFAGNPDLVIADEPVSALDVSVQAAITELLLEIQREKSTALLFISHDLSVVRYLADRIIVMYLGRIMEQGTVEEVFAPPYHPYTEALLAAAPVADTSIGKREIVLEGELPSPLDPPKGCPFSTRCPHRIGEICDNEIPPTRVFADNHNIACHLEPEDLNKLKPVFFYRDAGDKMIYGRSSDSSSDSPSPPPGSSPAPAPAQPPAN